MTPENQALVRDSFAQVVPIAPQAAALFYDRLFVLDPSLKPLFKGDMNDQGRKLMAMIGTAVANLDKLETIVPAVQDLAAAMPPTESRHRSTTRSRRHCCGPWARAWARRSRRRWKRRGPKPTRSSPLS